MTATLFSDRTRTTIAPTRRGACPSLARPMPTGDGLLVRLRPAAAGLPPAAFAAIARLAARHGNGLIEVTARGNLQIRGLCDETVPLLAAGISDAGIELRTGVAVETPPLAGVHPTEIADPSDLAEAIRAAIVERRLTAALAPKLSIVVDGGGALHLGGLVADIRLDAVAGAGDVWWRLSVGGDVRSARAVALVPENEVIAAVMVVLEALVDRGSAARGRDLDARRLCERLAAREAGVFDIRREDHGGPVGVHALGDARVLGIGLAYGQAEAGRLEDLMRGLEELGASEIRLAPGRSLLVGGLDPSAIIRAQALARSQGFRTDPDEPGNLVAVCAGAAGCASGHFDTKAAADLLIAGAPGLFDGSVTLHVSGCAKGCAHPTATALTFSGTPAGIGLILEGRAGNTADASVPAPAFADAVADLYSRIEETRQAGETVRSALMRIGKTSLAAAFQQGQR